MWMFYRNKCSCSVVSMLHLTFDLRGHVLGVSNTLSILVFIADVTLYEAALMVSEPGSISSSEPLA